MRILVIGSDKSWRMERGMEAAFRRMGHETLLLDDRRLRRNLGRRLTQHWVLSRARRFDPEFVFLSKCLGLDLETVERLVRGRPSAMWFMDSGDFRFLEEGDAEGTPAQRADTRHIVAAARLAERFHVNGFEERWREIGLNAYFLPAAVDRDIVPVASHPEYRAEATFIGRGYDAGRAAFLAQVAARVHLRTWGLGWEQWREEVGWTGRPVEGVEYARVCSSSGVVLGINPGRLAGATTTASNRMWVTCLAGGFYLGQRTPDIDTLLRGGEHCDYYDGLDDCLARIRRWLDDPVGRERVRAAGERFVRHHHTFDDRAKYVLRGERWVSPLA